ncbi:MAG TPA: ATP-dependent DNA helicase RecG [Acidimicrobiales bacterium]
MTALTFRALDDLPVDVLKKVGPKGLLALHQVGVDTVLDLLMYYPRRWIDRTAEASVRDAQVGTEALVVGEIRTVSAPPSRGRGPRRVVATLGDYTGRLSIVFFNQAWRERQLRPGTLVAVFGKVTVFQGGKQMANPMVDVLGDPDERPRPIHPVYPQSDKANVTTSQVLRAVEEALDRSDARGGIHDSMPAEVQQRFGLIGRDEAIHAIHLPDSMRAKEAARRRLAFEELFRVQLVLAVRKRALERDALGIQHAVDGGLVPAFYDRLPFPLTAAQRRANADIARDMAAAHPMHRLLQGDVGSGKTVVAVATLLLAVQGGHQGALMAPTEVLAEQHASGVRELLGGLEVPDDANLFGGRPLRVELLTNRVTGNDRRDVLAGLADGSVDLVVGTHALIQEGVEFRSLGAVVIDEQHRFGVEQRAALRAKGEAGTGYVPDVLVMTATPIPRTAAMTVYGDLDVSVLDELPPGRTPVATRWANGPLFEQQAWADVRAQVALGHQAYVVCPLIEESEKLEVASAEETFDRLAADELAGLRMGLLHGRLPAAEKEAVMGRFRRREIDVLVATTVIEVGVDVPNASIMVVLDADRFGIAQLHQLRGRVGRGAVASVCWLVTAATDGPSPRVEALVATNDGFELAEIDLDLRGEGTIMNTAQKGRSDLKLASLRRDRDLVAKARDAAFFVVDADPVLAGHRDLADELSLLLSPEDEGYLFKS